MLKKKRGSALIFAVILSLVAMYGFVPMVQADSLTSSKDTISNSDIGASNVSHTVQFTTSGNLTQDYYMQIIFPSGFTGIDAGNVGCPTNSTASSSNNIVECVVDAAATVNAGAQTITVGTTTNPGTAGDKLIYIYTRDSSNNEIQKAQVIVYILDNVSVSATVNASLTFSVAGLDAEEQVNGINTTATTTASSTPFGALSTAASSTVGQVLTVGTNASNGYKVTVQQDHELRTAGGAIINSFDNSPSGTGSSTAHEWAVPTGQLSNADTWGHMGITTDDANLSANNFGFEQFKGLNGTDPLEVMYHTGPADETTQNIGTARVAFSTQITALQEAGDYTSVITYVCTPQF